MPLLKTDGIVLTRRISGDSDIICSIYTREYGKLQFIFKGLKKTKKRSTSATEPGCILSMSFYSREHSRLNTVSSFEIVNILPGLRKDTLRIFSLYYIMELIDKTSANNDPSEETFKLATSGIKFLEKTELIMYFDLFFTVRYMSILGILPDTGSCVHCGSKNASSYEVENMTLRFRCVNCSSYQQTDIGRDAAQYIVRSSTEKFSSIDHSQVPFNDILTLFVKATGFIENYFGFSFKTVNILISNSTKKI